MSLDFTAIKAIPIADVLRRYNISLHIIGQWGSAVCPLPTHKEGDKSKSFSVNLNGNFWRCFSESCNANNGGKRGGDGINFVALMDGISQLDAAKKLADLFHIGNQLTTSSKPIVNQEKAPTHIEKGPVSPIEKPDANNSQYPNTGSGSVKYMQEVESWFDSIIRRGDQETDEQYRKRLLMH
jgi:hypothetical protein